MDKKLSNAFTFMLKDKDHVYKFIIIALLFVPSSYYSYFTLINKVNLPIYQNLLKLLSFPIIISILNGYFVNFTHNLIHSSDTGMIRLPDWKGNVWRYFVVGIRNFFAVFLILLAVIPGSILLAIPLILFLLLHPVLDNVYCTDFKISAYYAWKTAKNIIFANPKQYIVLLLLKICFLVLIILLAIIKPSILIFTVGSAISKAYFAISACYLIGTLSKNKEQTEIIIS